MDTAASNVGPNEGPAAFRLLLQDELERRCKKNPRFSLRAFARALSIEPSALSKILHGKRALTPKMLLRIATHLGMSEQDINNYIPSQTARVKSTAIPKQQARRNSDLEQDSTHKSMSLTIGKLQLSEVESLIENLQKDLMHLMEKSSLEGSQEQESFQLDIILSPRN